MQWKRAKNRRQAGRGQAHTDHHLGMVANKHNNNTKYNQMGRLLSTTIAGTALTLLPDVKTLTVTAPWPSLNM